jgi:hypothetical protein
MEVIGVEVPAGTRPDAGELVDDVGPLGDVDDVDRSVVGLGNVADRGVEAEIRHGDRDRAWARHAGDPGMDAHDYRLIAFLRCGDGADGL